MTDVPSWLVAGARVVHRAFGTGVVAHVGQDRGVPALWINFDAGMRKELAPEYALPHLRPLAMEDQVTQADPAEQCDYCGGRPMVVTVVGADRSQRVCGQHKAQLGRTCRCRRELSRASGEPPLTTRRPNAARRIKVIEAWVTGRLHHDVHAIEVICLPDLDDLSTR